MMLRRSALIGFALVLLAGTCLAGTSAFVPAFGADITDDGGRQVATPPKVAKVLPAGPPAAVILYSLAPDLMTGWPHALEADAFKYLGIEAEQLPISGRLTGPNGAGGPAVQKSGADLIVDIGSISPNYVALADRIQRETGVPYLLFDGSLDKTPGLYRTLGGILGREADARGLARYAEDTLREVDGRLSARPPAKAPRVYLARSVDGLDTALGGSFGAETIERLKAINVAAEAFGKGGPKRLTPTEVANLKPDVILASDPGFAHLVKTDPNWKGLPAVETGRVYVMPSLPFGWVDTPPASNRILGLRWLAKVLYPDLFPEDLGDDVRAFYKLFYHVDLPPAELDRLLTR